MPNYLLIYLIVALNALCQTMLIWRLKIPSKCKWQCVGMTIAIPFLIMVIMRLIVAGGMVQSRVADQSLAERSLTTLASVLLIAGPWLVTGASIFISRRERAALR